MMSEVIGVLFMDWGSCISVFWEAGGRRSDWILGLFVFDACIFDTGGWEEIRVLGQLVAIWPVCLHIKHSILSVERKIL